MRKIYLLILSVLSFTITGIAQTELIPPADGGFENGTTFDPLVNGWTLVNSGFQNNWADGTVPAGVFAGARGAYVSPNGAAYNYVGTAATSHLYKDVIIPAGATNIVFSFWWKGNIDPPDKDRLLVFVAPNTVFPVGGTPTSANNSIAGATLVFTQSANQTTFTQEIIPLLNTWAGTTIRLIFTWQNNAGVVPPPAAIDNISLTAVLPVPPTVTIFTPDNACSGSTPTVTITGTDFTDPATAKFNGISATSTTVVNATTITAVLPASGVTTGPISVTTPNGTGTSLTNFTINPVPTAVTVMGAGTFCNSTNITASNGLDGTIYFQGTTSGGTSIANPSTSENITTSGTYYFRARYAAGCWGPEGSAIVTIEAPLAMPGPISGTPTVCENSTGNAFSVTADPAATSYSWSYSGIGATINGSGSSVTVDFAAGATSGTLSVTANNTCGGGAAQTKGITINSNLPASVSIASDDADNIICAGTSVTFTATPTNGGAAPSYQWILNGSTNVGTNSATYTTTTLNNGDIITVILTSALTCATGNPATSNAITMTVNPGLLVSVSIAANPGTTICAGTPVTFTATPTNGGAAPSYQWKLNGGNVGSNSNTYTNAALANGDVVTVVLTSNAACISGNPATSNAITMTVNPNLPVSVSIAASPGNIICAGTSVTFTATPTNGGGAPSYQWKLNGGNVGSNSNTYTNAALANGDIITVVLTSNATCATGNPATSSGITMTVNPNLPVSVSIAANPGNIICAGTSVTFTATPTNGGAAPSYQWKVNGVNAGTNSATFTTSTLTNGQVVTVVLTSNATCVTGNPATSSGITMTVNPNLPVSVSIAANPGNVICAGTSVTFTATPTNGGGAPSYQWKLNGGNVGSNSNTYTNAALANGDIITVVLTSNATCATGNPATSSGITMTVNPNLPVSVSIAANPGNIICAGTSVTFTATPTNGGAAPSYQWKVNGVNAGTNSATFTTSTLTNGQVVTVVLTSNATCVTGNPATSSGITMTVNPNLPVSVSIAANPGNVICAGTSVTFTATPTNGGAAPSYQWKLNGVNVGSNSNTYTNGALANGNIVTAVLTSNATPCATGNPATSNAITMTVTSPPITTGITICQGGSGSLTSSAACAAGSSGTVGPKSPGTGSTSGIGTDWVNPTNVTVSDNNRAIADIPAGQTSRYLKASGFGFAIPAGANINGITVNIQRQEEFSGGNSRVHDADVLLESGVTVSNDRATATLWTNPDATATYGNAADNWGITWTSAQINDPTFGVKISATNTSGGINHEARVNYISITVTYSIPGTLNWYTASSGGTLIGNGSPFNPVGIAGSGLPDTNTPGTYTFYAECAGAPGCRTATNFIISPAPAIVAVTGGGTFCDGSTTITASGGAGGTIYYQGTTSGGTSTATPATTQSVSSSGTYYFRARSASGCWGPEGSVSVTIRPTPTATISGTATVCQGATAPNITFTNPQNIPVTVTYNINGGGTTTVNVGASTSVNVAAPTGTAGTFNYNLVSVVYQSAPACSNTISGTATVIVRPTPTATISGGGTTVCQGVAGPVITFTNPQALAVTVTYKINAGGNTTINVPANGTATLTAPTGTAGTFNYNLVSVAYQAGAGCSNNISGTATVIVRPTPTATISGTATACQNDPSPTITFTNPQALDETVTYNINGVGASTINVSANSTATLLAPTGASGTFNYNLVSVVYQTAPTCSNNISGTATVTVKPIPTGSLVATENSGTASNDNIICAGDNVMFTAPVGYGSYTFYRVGLGDTLQRGTVNIYNSSSLINGDKISVLVANSSNCGATFGPIIITVNPLPAPTLVADKNPICAGDNVTFTATGGTNYNFKVNGATVQNGGSPTYATTTLANNDAVTVDVTNGNGCTATSLAVFMTVNALPAGALTVSPVSARGCLGSSFTFTATGGTMYQFKVNGAVKQAFSVANTYTDNGFANGDIVTVDVNNGNCITTYTPGIPLTIDALPAGTLNATETSGTPNDNSICANAPVTFTATNGFSNYDFQVNGVSKQNSVSRIYNNSTLAANAAITVVVTSAAGCVATFGPVNITVTPSPTGTLTTPSATICAGDNITFTATSGFANYNFKINGVQVQNGSGNTYTTTAITNGNVVTVDVTNVNTCVTMFGPVNMIVNPLPTGTMIPVENSGIVNDGTICSGTSIVFTASAGYLNYDFIKGGVTVQSGGGNTYTTSALATGDVFTVAVTGPGGCVAQLNTITVTVNPLPVVDPIIGPFSVCKGSIITLSETTAGGVWSTLNPGIATVDVSGKVTGVSPGTAVINYTVTDGNSCATIVSATVTVNALPPVAAIVGNVNMCTNSAALFKDATPGGTWSSSNSGIASVDALGNVTTGGDPGGNVIIFYTTAPDANGCTNTAGINVTVNPSPVLADIIPNPADVCVGSTVKLNDATPGGLWTTGDGAIASVSATGLVSGIADGTVTIYYTITPSCGSPIQVLATVTVHPLPALTTVTGGGTFCGSTTLTADNTGDGTMYFQGTTSGGTSTATPSASQLIAASGTYYFRAQSASGCWGPQGSVVVVINPIPAITTVSGAGTFCGSTTITAAGGGGGTIYFQGTASGGTSTALGGALQTISTSGTYYFRSQSAAGCWGPEGSVTVTINAVPAVTTVSGAGTFCGSTTITASDGAGGTIYFQGSTSGGTSTATPSTSQLISASGTYYFRSQSAAGCWGPEGAITVTINPLPTATISGTIGVCQNDPSPNITFTGANGTVPYTFTYKINAGGNLNVTSVGNTATVSVPTGIVGSYTYSLVSVKDASSTTCSQNQVGSAIVTVNAPPSVPVITPTSATMCMGSIQPLFAGTTSSSSKSGSSGNINLTIPDNSPTGAANAVSISGIPVGAIINSVSVQFNIAHTNDGDLVINLKAPNNNVLNLVNREGGTGNNFANTVISSNGVTSIIGQGATFTNTYKAEASVAGTAGASAGGGNTVTTTSFAALFGTPNGNWQFSALDVANGTTGTITNWSITINYTIPSAPQAVTWSPVTDLYTDPAATIAYAGQSLSAVYVKPSTSVSRTYTATAINASNCTSSSNILISVNQTPVVGVFADYCAVAGKVRLTATATPAGATFVWSTGQTGSTIDVDIADVFSVVASYGTGCSATGTISVAQELVTNGDFEAGNNSFTSDYNYKPDINGAQLVPATQGELYDDSGNNGYSITPNGQYVHENFWGHDHSTATGNFMAVNGHGNVLVVWKQTVNVLPNTTYYFSAWAMSLNAAGNNAQLRFSVNGTLVGTTAALANHGESTASPDNWTRFYGTWTSGPATTTADIYINDLQAALGGNDFGLDDVSFGTLSTFIQLESPLGTDAQTVCENTPITDIVYSVGSTATGPTITGLPAGLTTSFNGIFFTITGTSTAAPGTYTYTITTTGTCIPSTATGTITIQGQKIILSSGSSSPTVCINNPVSIGFTLGGTATGATVSGLPATITGSVSGTTFTISGTPTVAGVYPYTITTSGTCTPVTFNGTITVSAQTITLNTANDAQTVCINTPIANIRYTVSGAANNATISGLPPGVGGIYNSGFFTISGTPTSAAGSPYTYTITTSGASCTPAIATGTIIVTPDATLTLTTGNSAQAVCINTGIADIKYTLNNATGASISGLPAGVSGSAAGGVFTISGAPAVGGVFNYTITTTDGCGSGTATGTITVNEQTIVLTSGVASPSVCQNAAMASIVFTFGGTATGATVSGLPAEFTLTSTGPNQVTLSGTPLTAGSYPYTITTSGGSCTPATFTGTITVQAAATPGTLTSVSTCSSTNGSLTLLGFVGTITQWESSTDNFATPGTVIANVTPTQTFNLSAPTWYRVLVTNGCGSLYSNIAMVGIHNLWTGAVSTDWNTAGNWSDNLVPSVSCPVVTVPQVPTNRYPVLSTGAIATIISLDIKANASVTITGNTMQVAVAITNAGTFDVTAGTLELNGSALQTIDGNTFVAKTINNLIISNNVNVAVSVPNDSLKISGQLGFGTVSSKTFNAGANNVTLLSTINGTANVGQILNSNAVSGTNFTVERFIPTGINHAKSWQLLATPTQGQTIKASWQEGATASNVGLPAGSNPHPGYGTMLTSAVAGAATQPTPGFDAFTSPGPSIKTYDYLTNGYDNGPSSTANQLYNQKGYIILVRGDRSVFTSGGAATQTKLRSTGTLFTPANPPPFTNVITGYFESMGNPYPSALDLRTVRIRETGAGANEFFYVWDPKLGGANNLGAYQTLSFDGTNYTATPGGGSYPGISNYLQSGQAFIVTASFTPGFTVNFSEDEKVGGSALLFTPNQPPQTQRQLRSSLYTVAGDGSTSLADGTLSQFNNSYSNAIDGLDARKNGNTGENLSIKTAGKLLAIERKHTMVENDTIFLNLTGTRLLNYRFEFTATDLDKPTLDGNGGNLQGFVEDTYLHTSTPLNLSGTTTVNFTIVNIPGSYAPDRFRIVFAPVKVLPVTFTSVKAYRQAASINVEWKVSNEFNIKQYEVEKSGNGMSFTTLAVKAPVNNQGAAASYYTADSKPADAYNYYRIRSVDMDGKVQYTSVVKVFMGLGKPEITIVPNPIVDGIIHLHLINEPAGQYAIRLLNKLGQTIMAKQITRDEGTTTELIKWDYNLAHGMYQLEITLPGGNKKNLNVLY